MARPDTHEFVKVLAWEPERDKPKLMKAVDDVVANNVNVFRLERMSNKHFWMALIKDGETQRFAISIEKGQIVVRTEAE